MAKSRVTTNPMYVGGAGGYSFYVRGGEQVIRQRKNNSNYGEGASRTRAQMIRRIRWGNLVNVFKCQKAWQPKAYDSKSKGQTDYNIFMALNINQATVGLTKEMCLSGCAVIEGYQVSRGSLPPISLTASGSGNQYVTDIKLTNAISGSTTVGQLAADILANNSQFVEGDNIAFVFFKNWKASRVEWPYAATAYTEITLDTTSTTVINSIAELDNRLSKSTGGFLQVSWTSAGEFDTSREVGFVAIHTRKSASMLAVSSQEILMNSNSLVSQFSGAAWDETCINSYGLTDEVPLDPSFKGAVIRNVAANGSNIPQLYGHVLEYHEDVTLVITGDGMNSSNVWLEHDGIRYTPLSVDGDSWTFILGDNGTNRLFVNGSAYGTIVISGIVVPDALPCRMVAEWRVDGGAFMNETVLANAYCVNYPYGNGVEDVEFRIGYGIAANPFPETTIDDWTGVNCNVRLYRPEGSAAAYIYAVVTDSSQVCYIYYKDFIVFVGNYE